MDNHQNLYGLGQLHFLERTLLPIINQAISESSFPVDLQKAEVTPPFKNDDRMNKEKYRPVSVLQRVSKP